MSAPAGPCEWCGGPQNWTVHAGVMYVRCVAGCQSLFGNERVEIPPPVSENGFSTERWLRGGTQNGTEGKTL